MARNPNWHRELIAQGGKVTNRTGSHFVADCGKGDEAETFARLFAAAPELLAALQKATHELNAIRARDGAPQHISWDRGHAIQTDGCTHEYWNALTEECFAAIAKATTETANVA